MSRRGDPLVRLRGICESYTSPALRERSARSAG
jgi:hypothetical protein